MLAVLGWLLAAAETQAGPRRGSSRRATPVRVCRPVQRSGGGSVFHRTYYRRTNYRSNWGGGYGYGFRGGYYDGYGYNYRPTWQPNYYQPYAPTVVQTVPVVVEKPVVVREVKVPWIKYSNGQLIQAPPAGFAETGHRLHRKGDDKGLVDYLKGEINGKKVKIEYEDDGVIAEIDD